MKVLPIEAQPAEPKRDSSKDDMGDFIGVSMISLTYRGSQPLESLLLSNEIPGCEFFQEGEIGQAQD